MSFTIWMLNHYATAWGSVGGTRHFDIARELVKKGHRVTICASSFEHSTRTEKKLYPRDTCLEEQIEGVTFLWFKTTPYHQNGPNRILNMVSYSVRVYRKLKDSKDIPDVIIGSLMHPLAALIGCLLARKLGCKFYFEERDLWPQTLIDLGKLSPWNPLVKLLGLLELYLYRRADKIIVLFRKAVEYVEQQGIHARKIVYLPNGVDVAKHHSHISMFSEEHEALFASLKHTYIAIYAGAHGMANNLDTVLDSARITGMGRQPIHYILIGDGPEKARLVRRKQLERLKNVTFLPPVAKEQIPAILQKAHVGLLPLVDSPVFQWGISPNKLYDYMAASLPVLVLCNAEDTDVERSGGGSVIKDDFAVNLALKLIEYAENPSRAKLIGAAGRSYVEKYHAWPILTDQLIAVLREDMENPVNHHVKAGTPMQSSKSSSGG